MDPEKAGAVRKYRLMGTYILNECPVNGPSAVFFRDFPRNQEACPVIWPCCVKMIRTTSPILTIAGYIPEVFYRESKLGND